MYYNLQEIKNKISGKEVAQNLGLRLSPYGRCICPGHLHNDRHLGNCVLHEDGCYCFVCNRFFSLPDMVVEVNGCSYKTAYQTLAEWAGVEASETLGKTDGGFPFTTEELKILGLFEGKPQIPDGVPEKMRRKILSQIPTLRTLFMEDKETALFIIKGKAKEKIKTCEAGVHAVQENMTDENREQSHELIWGLVDEYTICQRVLKKIEKAQI